MTKLFFLWGGHYGRKIEDKGGLLNTIFYSLKKQVVWLVATRPNLRDIQ